MVIEWLRFAVSPGFRGRFIRCDREIWTATLAPFPGFLSKSVWSSAEDDAGVLLWIEWASWEDWWNVPQALLRETEARFAAAVHPARYELREKRGFEVRDG